MKIISTLLILLSFSDLLQAETDDEWQYIFAPYLWTVDLDTDVSVGPFEHASSEVKFKDLIKAVDHAWMAYFEARKGEWAFSNETVYMKVTDNSRLNINQSGLITKTVNGKVKAKIKQGFTDFSAVYYPSEMPNTAFYAGARYFLVHLETEITGTATIGPFTRTGKIQAKHNEEWLDPLIGVRHNIPIDNKWMLTAGLNYAGGNDLDYSYISDLLVTYRYSKTLDYRLGYRYGKIKYTSSDFEFEQTIDGILGAILIRF